MTMVDALAGGGGDSGGKAFDQWLRLRLRDAFGAGLPEEPPEGDLAAILRALDGQDGEEGA